MSEVLGLDITSADNMPGYFSDHHLFVLVFNNSLLRDMTSVNLVKQVILDLKKQYAVPVYDRNNIHKTDEEDLVLTINDQLKKRKRSC